jgi:hypothetical protein
MPENRWGAICFWAVPCEEDQPQNPHGIQLERLIGLIVNNAHCERRGPTEVGSFVDHNLQEAIALSCRIGITWDIHRRDWRISESQSWSCFKGPRHGFIQWLSFTADQWSDRATFLNDQILSVLISVPDLWIGLSCLDSFARKLQLTRVGPSFGHCCPGSCDRR